MVGYQFLEHLAVEGSYGKTGAARGNATFAVPGVGNVDGDIAIEFSGLTIRLVGV
jgi:hypothetical protein